MSRPGPHKKHSLKENYTGSSKKRKKQLRTYVKRLGKATLHMLFPIADLGVGPGGSGPPFVREFFFLVNVCQMVLRALLLKYIFFNKHCY